MADATILLTFPEEMAPALFAGVDPRSGGEVPGIAGKSWDTGAEKDSDWDEEEDEEEGWDEDEEDWDDDDDEEEEDWEEEEWDTSDEEE